MATARYSRRNSWHSYIVLGLAGVTLFVGALWVYLPRTYRIATPPTQAGVTSFLEAFAEALERDRSSVRLRIVPFASHEEATEQCAEGGFDFAVARADTQLPTSALSVVELQRYVVFVVARPDVGINATADLRGRTVADLTRGTVGQGATGKFLTANQLVSDDVKLVPANSAQHLRELFAARDIDAAFVSLPRGSAALSAMLRGLQQMFGKPPVIVPASEAKSIAGANASYAATEFAAGELSAEPALPEKSAVLLTFPELLIARSNLPDYVVEELTRKLFQLRQSLAQSHPAAGSLAALKTDRGSAFAVHSGAAIYYNASESSFIDRHSSLIWLALFGVSTVISGALWLWRRVFPEHLRTQDMQHAELVSMIAKVRDSNDPAVWDAAERRVDQIIADLAQMSLNGDIDSNRRPAFDLAIARIERIIDSHRARRVNSTA